jgi:hypothetical protein
MKLQRKHRQLIALVIGIAIIVFGILQGLLKFNIDRKYTDEAIFVLFIVAAGILFGGRSKKDDNQNTKGE